MKHTFSETFQPPASKASRRDLIRSGGAMAAAAALGLGEAPANAAAPDNPAGNIYRAIGVSPLINC